jgi:hypothetical protein
MTPEEYIKRVKIAWQIGDLGHLLYDYQRPLYNDLKSAINDSDCLKYVLNCSRRWGKTTILCILALETCLQQPDQMVRFASPTQKELKKSVLPIMRMLIKNAPAQYKPIFKQQDGYFKFWNNSEIHLSGANNENGEGLRGQTSHLNIIDEAGTIDNLYYILDDILLPQTLTTGGTTLIASTPPKTPAHDFHSICNDAELNGYYKKYTIYDNTTIDYETIQRFMKESKGENSTTWKREYLAEFVTDENSTVIPEWKDEYVQEFNHDEYYRYYHKYECMDLGFKDFTACLFGYYDFLKATLFVEDELTVNGTLCTSLNLANAIKAKEKELWNNMPVYARRCDSSNNQFIATLNNEQDLCFVNVNNKDPEGQINITRLKIDNGKIIIHPRCKQLIGCLKYGVWDKNRKDLERSSEYGHYDHLMALVYLVKNLDLNNNPIPPLIGINRMDHYISNNYETNKITGNTKIFSDMLKPIRKPR